MQWAYWLLVLFVVLVELCCVVDSLLEEDFEEAIRL